MMIKEWVFLNYSPGRWRIEYDDKIIIIYLEDRKENWTSTCSYIGIHQNKRRLESQREKIIMNWLSNTTINKSKAGWTTQDNKESWIE